MAPAKILTKLHSLRSIHKSHKNLVVTLMMVILVLSTHFTYVCFLDGAFYLCSLDWIAFGNNFYHSFREIKTWADSQSSCEELNSHLVEIDSKAELVGHTLLLSCFFVTVCSESTGHEDLAN